MQQAYICNIPNSNKKPNIERDTSNTVPSSSTNSDTSVMGMLSAAHVKINYFSRTNSPHQ